MLSTPQKNVVHLIAFLTLVLFIAVSYREEVKAWHELHEEFVTEPALPSYRSEVRDVRKELIRLQGENAELESRLYFCEFPPPRIGR